MKELLDFTGDRSRSSKIYDKTFRYNSNTNSTRIDYGNGTSAGRQHQPPGELFTLFDYRTRLAQYRTDLDLLMSHQNYPWIPVWDDHEVADNTWKDGSSGLNDTEDSYDNISHGISVDSRKMAAVRAYFEWMPLRQVEMDDNLRIWRSFSLGSLVDLIMLDTR